MSDWQAPWLAAVGILLMQLWLFAPSLFGDRVLLPVDVLIDDNIYLPAGSRAEWGAPHNVTLGDAPLCQASCHLPFVGDLTFTETGSETRISCPVIPTSVAPP